MAISVEARTEIIGLVVGMFGAAPGASVLSSLVAASESGSTISQIAANLSNTVEFKSIYPTFLTNGEYAKKVVANLLTEASVDAKAEAEAVLTAALNGGMTRSVAMVEAIKFVSATANDNAVFGTSAAAFDNKVEVAIYYSVEKQQSGSSLEALQNVVGGVTSTAASVTAAKSSIDGTSNVGTVFSLTPGADTSTGLSGDDTFNALSIKADGAASNTFTAFDAIDGGSGNDTLNIYTTAAENTAFPASATVKNVETVNIYNSAAAAALADASKFEGVTALWQIGAAVAAVTNLGEATTAGFKDAGAVALTTTSTAASTTAKIAVNGVNEGASIVANGGTATNTLTITGTVKDTNADGAVAKLGVDFKAVVAQTALTVNSAINATLTASTATGLKSIDASGSTGAIAFTGGTGVGTIKSGSGGDTISVSTTTSSTLAAVVETGAGNDGITVATTGTGTTTVDSGAGKDTVTVNSVGSGKVSISTGADDDKVTLTNGIDSVKTTDVLDGGDGSDTLSIAGKTFDAEDYIVLTDVIKNFEVLQLTSAGTVDASKLAAYTQFVTTAGSSTFTKVAAAQTLKVTAGVTASASGYVAPAGAAKSGTLAGTLNITADGTGAVVANAEIVNLTITPVTDKDGAVDNTAITLTGDAKTVNVTLNATSDSNNTAVTTDDVLETSQLIFTNVDAVAGNDAMTTLTVSGNGTATVTNADSTGLVTVDASGLASKTVSGAIATGLVYVTTNTASESVTLGAGKDSVTITGSTFLKSDTISGLTLVDNAAVAGTQVDAAKSDALIVKSNNGTTMGTFVKTTTTAASLNLALVDLAASANDKLVFQFGGDTYIYADVANTGAAGDNILNDTDVLIKLTGAVDLDLLVSALG